jgi:hypothetical protein
VEMDGGREGHRRRQWSPFRPGAVAIDPEGLSPNESSILVW